jgi:hypothetical protein
MTSIRPVIDQIRLAWWRWAGRELTRRNPLHPDLPAIVLRIHALEARQ